MQCLEVSGPVRPLYGSLGVKGLSLFAVKDKKLQVKFVSDLLSHIGGIELGLHSFITSLLDGTSALIINS